ncbi:MULTISPECIES: CGNR zinc finger domain-containing protein [unclassified Isoptericola]|uniref:CGNR zinc finger domain-containing protein n=1 Tax=unclassified Isoptericola TaxID=2623355 RepID=UPI003650EBC1
MTGAPVVVAAGYRAARTHLVPALSLACVTTLVNEWGTVPRETSPRPWAGHPGTGSPERRLLAAEWGSRPPSDAAIAAAADTVHPVFAAASPAERARRLDALVAALGVVPRVTTAPAGPVLDWAVHRRADLLAAALAVALLPAPVPPVRAPRLGTCGADDCADVFADVSPRQDRAYCSTRCQTRQRARAHRARRRTDVQSRP